MAETGVEQPNQDTGMEIIKAGGDLILVIGSPPTTSLLVSTLWLSSVSPVFHAMFDGSFSEAAAPRSSESPQKMPLPDDSVSGMRDMCALLHHNMDIIRMQRWNTSRVLELAISVDKYGCFPALQLQCQSLMLQYLDRHNDPNYAEDGDVVAAAWLLQDARAFEAITKRMIMQFCESFARLRTSRNQHVLPYNILFALEERRNLIQQKISLLVFDVGTDVHYGCGCNCLAAGLTDIFEIRNWPPDFKIGTIRETIEILKGGHNEDIKCNCGRGTPVPRIALTELGTEIEDTYCHGLCLWCLKEDGPVSSERCSRHYRGMSFDVCNPSEAGSWT